MLRPALLALFAFVVSLLFSWMVPLGNNPDEIAHWDYIRLIQRDHKLPVFLPPVGRKPLPAAIIEKLRTETGKTQLSEGELSRDEVHQPPLYYVLASIVAQPAMGGYIAARMLSAIFSALTVFYICLWYARVFKSEATIALGMLVGLMPAQAQLGGAVSNDALTHLLCALLIGESTVITLAKEVTRRQWITLGVVVSCGLATKLTVIQLLPWLVIVCLAVRIKYVGFDKKWCFQLLGVVGAAIIALTPMWLRNLGLYSDPLARSIYVATGPNFSPTEISQLAGWSTYDYYRQVGIRTFASFWYFIDPNTSLNRFQGDPLPLGLVLTVVIPSFAGIYKQIKSGSTTLPKPVFLLLPSVLVVILPFYGIFVSTVFQAQGRYFLPALLPVTVLTTVGWAALGKASWLIYLPVAVMGFLSGLQLLNGGFAAR